MADTIVLRDSIPIDRYYQTLPSNDTFYEPTGMLDLFSMLFGLKDSDVIRFKNVLMGHGQGKLPLINVNVVTFYDDESQLFGIEETIYYYKNVFPPRWNENESDLMSFLSMMKLKYNLSWIIKTREKNKHAWSFVWMQLYIMTFENSQLIPFGLSRKGASTWLIPNDVMPCTSIEEQLQGIHLIQMDRFHSMRKALLEKYDLVQDVVHLILQYLFADNAFLTF